MITTRSMTNKTKEFSPGHIQRKLTGVCITFTDFEKHLKLTLIKVVSKLGGTYSKSVTALTTHIVAHKTTNSVCFQASQRGLPILNMSWLKGAIDAAENIDVKHPDFYNTYLCKTFEGVQVCVSKCSQHQRDEIRSTIEAGGGHYSLNLQKNKTDVVIVPTPVGDKFKWAKKWNIPTVSPTWVTNSAIERRLMSFSEFEPTM